MSNRFVEQFARMAPEAQEREQLDELKRLAAGEMPNDEWVERSDAWLAVGRRDFDPAQMWDEAHKREEENAKRKPWDKARKSM